ncbi:MAG: purine/pyrimidine permease [Bacteroidales bacterium]|jgi:xanthine permease XanP|nr:purine/pyrimidine permease [Bacteroidales bacterium]
MQKQNFLTSFIMASQLVAASIATIIAPPVIIANSLGLPPQDATFLVSMSLLLAGVGTFLQCRRVGGIGVGLIVIEGINVTFISMIIAFGQKMIYQGLPVAETLGTVFGSLLAASLVVVVCSFFIKYIKRFFPPFVLGIILALLGLCLLKVFMIASAGGENVVSQLDTSPKGATIAMHQNLAVALTVIIVMLVCQFSRIKWLVSGATLWAFVVGIVMAYFMGILPDYMPADRVIVLPEIMKYQPFGFNVGLFTSAAILMLFYMLLNMGVLSDLCRIYDINPQSKEATERISGGLRAMGINSALSSLFCVLPTTPYAQINGMIFLSGVKSVKAGYLTALMFILIGFFPAVTALFICIPQSVLGGISLLLFGTIAISGFEMMFSDGISTRKMMIMAVSFALGLGVELYPTAISALPDIFASGINTGGLCACLLHWILPKDHRKRRSELSPNIVN